MVIGVSGSFDDHVMRAFCKDVAVRTSQPRIGRLTLPGGVPADTEMPDEERLGGVVLEDRHPDVTSWVDVEGEGCQ